ncbi:fibronectin type III domain-containing protein [SAR202 cluster bacterium AC-647-N09_OGT_505m]|nr:fibronectin type III domain-containing protein [SAR202 cluster bacterium AC-647-N09_OGT_505m]
MKLKSVELFLLLPALMLLVGACSGGTVEPLPTYTPYPTYTAYTTLTPVPPTAIPYPTYIPVPTPTPTATPVPPIPTLYPTYTPYPTFTPVPTYTPYPTYTTVPAKATAVPIPGPIPAPSPSPDSQSCSMKYNSANIPDDSVLEHQFVTEPTYSAGGWLVQGLFYNNDEFAWVTQLEILFTLFDRDNNIVFEDTYSPLGTDVVRPEGYVFYSINLAHKNAVSWAISWSWGWSCSKTELPLAPRNTKTTFPTSTVPGVPTNATAAASNTEAMVFWSAPVSTGGAAITSYKVTADPGGQTITVGGSTLTATFTGLTNGTYYTFTVVATNSVGDSAPSIPSSVVQPLTLPGAPTSVSATAENGQATVTWSVPSSDGGSSITVYTVTASPGGQTITVSGSTLTATFTTLINGAYYIFTVVATNSVGDSAPSTPSSVVQSVTVPGASTNVTATAGNAHAGD